MSESRATKLFRRGARRLTPRASRSPEFATDDVVVGRNVRFGQGVVFNCDRVRIGDGVVLQDNIRVDCTSFEIGDYGTVYSDCFFPGPGFLTIGHNFWLGKDSIVDSQGGTSIGNNVGVGAQSQLWTHMAFGDVLAGCRFHSARELLIGNDVWFVGHCLVSPITAGDRSLAMLGSLVTKNMDADHVYAGVPASDITDKTGPQFEPRPICERVELLEARLDDFGSSREIDWRSHIRIAEHPEELERAERDLLVLNVADRTYAKRRTPLENDLIRYLLPEAKFVPAPNQGDPSAAEDGPIPQIEAQSEVGR